uniref:BED-type domain-containing protein n=1 Tax=Anopheles christyi TaxID=43041 RepID=A0A182K8L1_9DIPT
MSRLGRMISSVWNHFERLGDRAKCHHCQNTFSFSTGSTANLKRHLARKHPMDPLEETLSEAVESEPGSPGDENQTFNDGDQTWTDGNQTWDDGIEESMLLTEELGNNARNKLVSNVWNHFERDGSSAKCLHCYKLLTYTGSTSNLRKHIYRQHPSFTLTLGKAAPTRQFEMSSKYDFKCGLLRQTYETLQKNVKGELAAARAISLGVNSAESTHNETVFSVTSYFIDQDGKLSNALLDFAPFLESDTEENIAAHIREVMKVFEIEGKVDSIVTDNVSNLTLAARSLNIPHVTCFIHSLDPVVLSALKNTIQSTIDEVRHVVAQFRRSTKARNELRDV